MEKAREENENEKGEVVVYTGRVCVSYRCVSVSGAGVNGGGGGVQSAGMPKPVVYSFTLGRRPCALAYSCLSRCRPLYRSLSSDASLLTTLVALPSPGRLGEFSPAGFSRFTPRSRVHAATIRRLATRFRRTRGSSR